MPARKVALYLTERAKYDYYMGCRLKPEDGPRSSDTVTNTYTSRLRTALSLAQPTGGWTNGFGYDASKRITSVNSPAGTFSCALGGAGAASPLIKKLSLPNTSYLTNHYDSVARLLFTKLNNSSHSTLNSHTYSYNAGSERTEQVFSAGSTYGYTYDSIGQLKVADSATASEDRGYAYDAAWNLNYRTNNTTTSTFSVDGENQLASTPEGGCTYDNNGNLTISHSERRSYDYDDENRLSLLYVSAHVGVQEKATEFFYDGLGRLRKRLEYHYDDTQEDSPGSGWVLDSETRYVYDGWRVIQERDGSNTPLVSYTRGTDLSGSMEGAGGIGGLLGRSHGYSSGSWSTHNFYHADGNGNVTYLVDSSQALAASYRYDPFGNTISSSGSLASANVYRFSSKEVHAISGLYYYGYRFYEPNLQRWLSRDPIGNTAGVNLYSFVGNRSINSVDELGLLDVPIPTIPNDFPLFPPWLPPIRIPRIQIPRIEVCNPLQYGSVEFVGCSQEQLSNFRTIPEEWETPRDPLLVPREGSNPGVDGFYSRNHRGEWFKIPLYCHATVTCNADGFDTEVCCSSCVHWLVGSDVGWLSDRPPTHHGSRHRDAFPIEIANE